MERDLEDYPRAWRNVLPEAGCFVVMYLLQKPQKRASKFEMCKDFRHKVEFGIRAINKSFLTLRNKGIVKQTADILKLKDDVFEENKLKRPEWWSRNDE